jgi:hypothetical protein
MVTLALAFAFAAIPALPQEPASPAPVRKPPLAAEAKYVAIVDVPLPAGVVLEVGGMVLRGDTLFAATRRGEIWQLENVSGPAPRARLWAEGLQEPLGLLDHDGWLYCAQRGELSRLRDRDGDGRMDDLETVADGWHLSGNYHEYAFGPARAGDGSFWLTLNKPFGKEPFGAAPWRGWAIRVPAAGGSFEPVGAGLRSPCGVATAPDGVVWYSDNQGEWCATSKFAPLRVGEFHGHPWGIDSCKLPASRVAHPGEVASGRRLADAARTIPNFTLPAVWIPYDLCGRSPGDFVWDTAGHFPPFRGQVFCGDQFSAEVFRMSLEQVGGAWQGACYPFRAGLQCGVTRVLWGKPGVLWCGLTNRGWGSRGDADFGLQRLEWKGEVPFELAELRATKQGFTARCTAAVDAASATVARVVVRSWTYDHHEGYGCPPREQRDETVTAVRVLADGVTLQIELAQLATCRVYEVAMPRVRSATDDAVLHGIGWYTRNREP